MKTETPISDTLQQWSNYKHEGIALKAEIKRAIVILNGTIGLKWYNYI